MVTANGIKRDYPDRIAADPTTCPVCCGDKCTDDPRYGGKVLYVLEDIGTTVRECLACGIYDADQTYADGSPMAPGDSLEDNPQGGGVEPIVLESRPADPPHPNTELLEISTCPTTPRWLVELIPILLDKDPVDVSNAFHHMNGVFHRRLDAMLASAQVEIHSYCDGCKTLQKDVEIVRLETPSGWTNPANYCSWCRVRHEAVPFQALDVDELADTLHGLGMNVIKLDD